MSAPLDANKALAAGGAGAASVVLVWLVGLFGVAIPPEVASAITTLAAAGFAWLIPHRSDP